MSKTQKVKVLVDVYYSRSKEFEMEVPAQLDEEGVIDFVDKNIYYTRPDMSKETLREDEWNHQIVIIEENE